jgi:hypothetical protein
VSGAAPQSVADCEYNCDLQYPGNGAEYLDCVDKCVRALCDMKILPPGDCL